MTFPKHHTGNETKDKLEFFYHFYGEGDGMLSVYTTSHDHVQWSTSPSDNFDWLYMCLDLPMDAEIKPMFKAVRGNQDNPVAIDDIKISHGTCESKWLYRCH